jgi:hypothetical protein
MVASLAWWTDTLAAVQPEHPAWVVCSACEGGHVCCMRGSVHACVALLQVIDNLPDDFKEEVKALDFPGRSEQGYTVPLTKVCYIESTDFREKDAKDYYGLAPGKSVMFRCGHAPFLRLPSYVAAIASDGS